MSRKVRPVRIAMCVTLLGGAVAATLSSCSSHKGSGTGKQPQTATSGCTPGPFVNTNGTVPPNYNKPLFQLSHAYPATVPPLQNQPWRDAIHDGQITTDNARDYVMALKGYVAAAMRKMLMDPDHWNAAADGWYNEPWTGCLREPIHGMYLGTKIFPVDQYPGTGLTKPFSTYVLTFYDRQAANTLYGVWGVNAQNPAIGPGNGGVKIPQFVPGSVIVKAAFTTADANSWPPMEHALQWPAYVSINATKGRLSSKDAPELDQLSFLQFDIIVKDPASSPRTGWVYATLVYDKRVTGNVWDRMVPLGVMWGNDPDIVTTGPNQPKLRETWINPQAPAYAKTTLGWGGRLSGPNDGALNNAVVPPVGLKVRNLPSSSCLGCHISAEYPMKSFLLPTTTYPPQSIGPKDDDTNDFLVMSAPGSRQWMRWFQSTPGNQPMDAGTTALDYDMVLAFKSLQIWQNARNPNQRVILLDRRGQPLEGYNGKPISE
jgi:hypothetical protein